VPGAANVELGALGATSLPEGPVVTMCGHSERATTGASVLERAGRRDVSVLTVGPGEWATAAGGSVEVTA
jgi:rhodanese-related sulfurtransferase